MRIHIKLTPNKETVPFDHNHLITGKLHYWIGENEIHNATSLYSFSQLQNGSMVAKGFEFKTGSSFFFSSWDNTLIKKIIKSIQSNPEFLYGMKVEEIILQETPDLADKTNFQVASPVFIKRRIGDRNQFYLYDNPKAPELLKETILTKMKKAGLPIDESLNISFDLNYQKRKTKMVNYKKGDKIMKNKSSLCPLIIEGKTQTKEFIWHVGAGSSTGIGLGAIK